MKKIFFVSLLILSFFYNISSFNLKDILARIINIGFYQPDNFEKQATQVAGATNKYQLQINVTSYGTVGNGVKDDGPAIQAALNYADSIGGGVVFVPAGIYLIVNPGNGDSGKGKYGLRIGSNTTLRLAADATLHKGGNNDVIGNKDVSNGNANIKITGGKFKTDSGTDQPWAPTRTGILLVNTTNSVVSGCAFEHIGNTGVVIAGAKAKGNKVTGCNFNDVRNAAVVLEGVGNTVTHCIAKNIGGDGIIVNAQNCLVSANLLTHIGFSDEPGGSGISLGVDRNVASKNQVTGNTISDAYANGIISDRGSYSLINANSISNTGLTGIKIGGDGNNSVIYKNKLQNIGTRSNSMSIYAHTGILIDGPNVTAKYNTLTKVKGTAIYINTPGTGAVLLNNSISFNTDAADKAVKNAGIEIHAGNVSVTGGSATNITGDACYIYGNIKNITVTGGVYKSGNGSSFKIDGAGANKPSKILISGAAAASPAGLSVVQGDDVTFDNVTGDSLKVSPGATHIKKVLNKKVQVF